MVFAKLVRVQNKKYGVDIVGKVFDRLSNTTEGRLTCIDPVTIAYLNSGNAKDEDASEEVLNAIATNRKSRAHVLHGAFEQNEHIQLNDAELKTSCKWRQSRFHEN